MRTKHSLACIVLLALTAVSVLAAEKPAGTKPAKEEAEKREKRRSGKPASPPEVLVQIESVVAGMVTAHVECTGYREECRQKAANVRLEVQRRDNVYLRTLHQDRTEPSFLNRGRPW